MDSNHLEIEVRFLEIDIPKLKQRLEELGAQDLGEQLHEDIVFYDHDLTWSKDKRKFVRLRKTKDSILLTFKHNETGAALATEEIELSVSDMDTARLFLERIGLIAVRFVEQKSHSYQLGEVTVDIRTRPKMPQYIELEGPSESALKEAAAKLELDWKDVILDNPITMIEKYYHIPVSNLTYFTFDRVE